MQYKQIGKKLLSASATLALAFAASSVYAGGGVGTGGTGGFAAILAFFGLV